MEVDKKAYGKYVDEITPKHNLPLNMARAFLTGGAVCTVGQLLINAFQAQEWKRRPLESGRFWF